MSMHANTRHFMPEYISLSCGTVFICCQAGFLDRLHD